MGHRANQTALNPRPPPWNSPSTRSLPSAPAGSPTQPVEAGYMANAWMRMRHPDYDQLRQMLEYVGRTVRVRAA